jgi:hypothetical protein
VPPNELAAKYLQAFADSEEFPGGLSFRSELTRSRLDFTRASLERIDILLDQIRTSEKPNYDVFLEEHANQNFLYLLCFYVGTTMSRCSDQRIAWLDYDEMIRRIPDNGAMFPRCFATSITCILERRGFFVPLASIVDRLFFEPPQKSVKFSAEGFM